MAEEYVGVKFECVLKERRLEEYAVRIKELVAFGKRIAAMGLAHGNEGNMSVRVASGFLIKAAGANLGKLGGDDFALVTDADRAGFSLAAEGTKKPSSESMTHYAIYAARKDIEAIVHVHNDRMLANAEKFGIPATKEHYGYGTIETARATAGLLANNDLVAVKGHGFFAVGRSLDEALALLDIR